MGFRVTIFDDNRQRRDGLELLISSLSEHECVGSFTNCSNVVEDVNTTNPDLVLMDIDMPNVNGIEGVKQLRAADKTIKVFMQTVFEDDEKVFAAICAGADGYILKQTDPTKLLVAIDEMMDGGAPMTPVIAQKVLQYFKQQAAPKSKQEFDLTKREQEILNLLVKGYSYKMIAEECHISYPTVNTHVSNIYSKLQVNSVSGAVSIALREGLVS